VSSVCDDSEITDDLVIIQRPRCKREMDEPRAPCRTGPTAG
jgi:hypothetical protein